MYVFDMETGDAYSVDFAHLQTYLQQLLIDRANCENAYYKSLGYALSAYLTRCNNPAVQECEDMLHIIFAYEEPVDASAAKQLSRLVLLNNSLDILNDLRKPVDLGEDREQYAESLRFYRNHPELDWDGDLSLLKTLGRRHNTTLAALMADVGVWRSF